MKATVSTTFATDVMEKEKIKAETSTHRQLQEIEYVDIELFSQDEETKVGIGKVV